MLWQPLRKVTKLIFDQPFLYHHLRSIFLGGLHWPVLLELLDAQDSDVILDVACGNGSLASLIKFKKYIGIDHDPRSLRVALRREIRNTEFLLHEVNGFDFRELRPTKAVLSGLLHHLSDPEAIELLNSLSEARVEFAVTVDSIYEKGHWLNNLLCRLDRGNFVRTTDALSALIQKSKMRIDLQRIYSSNTGITRYVSYRLLPANS